jgi:hypothetical protein
MDYNEVVRDEKDRTGMIKEVYFLRLSSSLYHGHDSLPLSELHLKGVGKIRLR